MSDFKDRASELASDVAAAAQRSAKQMADSAAEKLQSARQEYGDKLKSTADSMSDAKESARRGVDKLARTASEKMDAGSEYLRSTSGGGMLSDIGHAVRQHPGAIIAAVAVGIALGYALTSRSDE